MTAAVERAAMTAAAKIWLRAHQAPSDPRVGKVESGPGGSGVVSSGSTSGEGRGLADEVIITSPKIHQTNNEDSAPDLD